MKSVFAIFILLSSQVGVTASLKNCREIKSTASPGFQKYQQFYSGFPVIGGEVTVHEKKMSGQLIQNIQLKPETLQELANGPNSTLALNRVKELFAKKQPWAFSDEHSELVIKMINGKAIPAFMIRMKAHQNGKTPADLRAYSEAEFPFKPLAIWNNIQYFSDKGPGGNDRTGSYTYGANEIPSLSVIKQNSECLMKSNEDNFRLVDMRNHFDADQNSEKMFYSITFSYHCADQNRDAQPYYGALSPNDDAFYFTKVTIDFFKDWYQERPLQNSIIIRNHYDQPYLGGLPLANAFYDEDSKIVNLGNGSSPDKGESYDNSLSFYPLTSLDVVAHELGHAYTSEHSNLAYYDQSGSMNESFSDMAGTAAMEYLRQKNPKLYQLNYHSNRPLWMMGSSIMRSADPNIALRYMDRPSKDKNSVDCFDKTFVSDGSCQRDYKDLIKWSQSVSDNPIEQGEMLVHFGSGIYNRWFYVLANTKGWSIKEAFGLAIKANRDGYWKENSSFQEAACATLEAVGINQAKRRDVVNAFLEVGISTRQC